MNFLHWLMQPITPNERYCFYVGAGGGVLAGFLIGAVIA